MADENVTPDIHLHKFLVVNILEREVAKALERTESVIPLSQPPPNCARANFLFNHFCVFNKKFDRVVRISIKSRFISLLYGGCVNIAHTTNPHWGSCSSTDIKATDTEREREKKRSALPRLFKLEEGIKSHSYTKATHKQFQQPEERIW